MKGTQKLLLAGGVTVAVLLPAGSVMAQTTTPVCDGTGRHEMKRDGTGSGPNWSASAPGRQAMTGNAKVKAPYGKRDGTGPYHTSDAVRPMDGTGRRVGPNRA